jgi:hypothetical protein
MSAQFLAPVRFGKHALIAGVHRAVVVQERPGVDAVLAIPAELVEDVVHNHSVMPAKIHLVDRIETWEV